MKEDALELLMGTYQQTSNQAKVIDAANRLLAVNPDSARALVLLAYNERAAQKWADAKQHTERGLQAITKITKPDNVSDADFAKQKTQLAALLNSIAGFSALQLKDYASAQKYLRPAVEADPNNVENVYALALAYLTATPSDDANGLFFIARAANLVSDPKGKDSIVQFGHSRYTKYHGSDQGWDDLLALTKTTLVPPAGFSMSHYVPPNPAEPAAAEANQSQQYVGTSEYPLSIRVLQTEQVPYSVQYGGGGSATNCSINGSTYTTGSATSIGNFTYGNANSNTDLSMHCNTQENPPMQWRHVLNTMLVVASNGNAYIIACDAAWRWSKCRGLVTGDTFQAKMTSKGLVVQYVLKDNAKEGTYSILRGKVLGQ